MRSWEVRLIGLVELVGFDGDQNFVFKIGISSCNGYWVFIWEVIYKL